MMRSIMIMATSSFVVFGLDSEAFAQECGSGCVPVSELTEECIPPLPDNCPLQALPTDEEVAVAWLYDNGGFTDDVLHSWNQSPYPTDLLLTNPIFTYPMIGEGTSTGSSEWACGITIEGGEVACFGYSTVLDFPTGEAPYSALSSGGTGRYGVLDSSGQINIWGNVGGTFGSTVPSTSGFSELGIGRDVGCAVGISNGGVTCWGDNSDNLVTNASKPASGTYTAVEVGRYVAGAVQDDGTLDMWSTARAGSGMVTKAAQFVANRPTGTNVKSFELGETGELIGVAWMTDNTAYIWFDSTIGVPNAVRHAPGWSDYGNTVDNFYIPQGPDGPITFRSRLEISATDIDAQICAVIDDPQGLYDGASTPVAFEYGDAICWAQNGAWPRVEAKCEPQYW